MRIYRETEGLAAAPSEAWRRELRSLDFECDVELRGEGLLSLASRLESRGDEAGAAEIYRRFDADSFPSNLRERAGRRLAGLAGEGPVGDRVERGFRHFVSEVTNPASLAAMAVGGLAFRATRLAVLGRLAASNGLLSGTRAASFAASLAGFAVEAPLFTLSSKLGHQAMGREQDWSGEGLSRELASSYLFLGALRLSGATASAAYRRVGGAAGSPLQGVFTQLGIFTGILGAHALQVQAGLAPRRDGLSVLVDSLILQLHFNATGRLSQSLLGEGGRRFEREMDLRGEILARPPAAFAEIGRRPMFPDLAMASVSIEGTNAGELLPSRMRPVSTSPENVAPGPRPALKPSRASEPARSAEDSIRRLIAESVQLEEPAKREVIRRIQGGDQAAKEELIRSDIRFVRSLARAYGFRGQELLDATQEGQIGLLEGADRFDFRDVDFLTYAQWRIRSRLTGYARDYLAQVRLPAHQLDMLRHLNNETRALSAHNDEIDAAELAERLEITPKQLEDLQGLSRSRYLEQIDAKRGSSDDGYDLHDVLPDKRPLAHEQLVGRRLQSLIEEFISGQDSEVDRFLLTNRLFSSEELSHEQVAARLGSSPSLVKRREISLLRQLRVRLEHQGVRSLNAEPLTHAALFRAPRIRTAALSSPASQETRPSTGSGVFPALRPRLEPRIAIVGFGMAGVGAANALRNYRLFSGDAREFEPRITVFEGMNRVGGKVAPDNLGAQFVDAEHFYPIDRMIQEHGLEAAPQRHDYDLAPFVTPSGAILSGRQFSQALRILRQSAREALRVRSWEDLDRQSSVDFIQYLGRRNGPLAPEEVAAMVSRLGFEEGSLNVSALSFAINLAKSETPMPRYELIGGLHRLVDAEMGAVMAAGGELRLGQPVRGARAMADGVQLFFNEGGMPRSETFDYAILALAPEHLRGFEVSGSEMPIGTLARLEPAHIRKTNLRSHLLPPTEETANPHFARWNSPDPLNPRLPMVTFFHGWNGEKPLTYRQMMLEAYGREDAEAMLQIVEQIWDGRLQDGIPHFYTTMPQPGTGYEVARFAMDQYFNGRYDAERLRVANHTLGLGCYTRDAALAGELAAYSLLRGAGFNVDRAQERRPDAQRELLGADRIR